jgi:hypothetical protein
MTDYLADVVMPTQEPQSESPETALDTVMDEQLNSDNTNLELDIDLEEDYQSPEEDVVPEPIRRRKIPQEEIFTPPKVKTILDPDSLKDPSPSTSRPKKGRTKEGKGTRKPRGPATPEQLERLARGRAKAQETRDRKKLEKQEQLAKEKADKDLVEAVREKERQKMRKRLEEPEGLPPVREKIIEKPVVVEKGYSQEQLDEAVSRAVEMSVNRVETLRKQRKEQKQKAEAKAKHDAKVFKDINSALKPTGWDICFT